MTDGELDEIENDYRTMLRPWSPEWMKSAQTEVQPGTVGGVFKEDAERVLALIAELRTHRAALPAWEELLKAVDKYRQYVPDPQIAPLYETWRAARAKLEELRR